MKTKNNFKQTEIGEIPEDWEVRQLGDSRVSEIIMGQSPDSSTYNTEKIGLPFYQGKVDFGLKYPIPSKWCSSPIRLAKKGDILLSVRAPVGDVNLATEECCIGRGITALRAGDGSFNEFLFYFMLHSKVRLNALGTGAIFKAINKETLLSFPVIIPPKSEQEKIAGVLTKIQKAVENQEKLVKNLKELKSATMAKLFREGLNGEPLKQTEIGEIPKSWEVMRLGEIVDEIFAGGDVPKNNFSKLITDEYKIPIYTNGEKKQGLYGYTNIIKVSKPSLTISSRGTIGYCVLREKPYFPAIRLIVILPNLNIVSLYYLKFAIEINNFEKYFDKSPIPQLTVPMAKRIIIPLPNKDEQEEIANILTSIDNKIEIEGKKLEVYNEFFSSTLNQLMTGKIRVN
ncbi:MAG: restriction endonuclease subunit S [Elusimicrobiales bacterium]|nr:restriction endonuclease subunit S [Elusimicrobiales bacterium]